jgi:hypothetical protein
MSGALKEDRSRKKWPVAEKENIGRDHIFRVLMTGADGKSLMPGQAEILRNLRVLSAYGDEGKAIELILYAFEANRAPPAAGTHLFENSRF